MGEMPVMVLFYLCFARWDGDVGHCLPLPAFSAVPGSSSSCFPLGIRLLEIVASKFAVLVCLCPRPALVSGMLMALQGVII